MRFLITAMLAAGILALGGCGRSEPALPGDRVPVNAAPSASPAPVETSGTTTGS